MIISQCCRSVNKVIERVLMTLERNLLSGIEPSECFLDLLNANERGIQCWHWIINEMIIRVKEQKTVSVPISELFKFPLTASLLSNSRQQWSPFKYIGGQMSTKKKSSNPISRLWSLTHDKNQKGLASKLKGLAKEKLQEDEQVFKDNI
jgi:hypothetical protein